MCQSRIKCYRHMTDELMLEKLNKRHMKRQCDIDNCYSTQ